MQILQESEGATLNGGNYIDVHGSSNVIHVGSDARKGKGIKLLLKSCVQREAIHDSSSHGDLGCHPGTRGEYIRDITSWGNGQWESEKRAFLMTGPAGAGKSAIARTCARELKTSGNFGASFFFYRPSRWNDPTKFIPTIVYQLTTQYSAYRDCIDAVILDDPLVLEKEMSIQFLELLVKPLLQPSVNGHNVEAGLVIVVDGLDECATVDAQLQIINLIATSIRERTTPFLWAFFSRPEPPITSAFSRQMSANLFWTLPLTLSGNAKSDIEAYLRGSFQVIRAKHNIPQTVAWPKEIDIRHLVSQSAGLFVYAVTAIRYIDGLCNGRVGFEERLRAVLQVHSPSAENPFSTLDHLYTLLMMQIPEGILYDTLSLLHLDQSAAYRKYHGTTSGIDSKVVSYCLALGLSSAAFHAAISNLYSVLHVTNSQREHPNEFRFYHKSFLDFLLDERRSKLYFIQSKAVHQYCLEKVICTLTHASNANPISPSNFSNFPLQAFFALVEENVGKLEETTLQQISQVVWKFFQDGFYDIDFPTFIEKVPEDWRSRIIRPSSLLRAAIRAPGTFGLLYRCQTTAYLIRLHMSAILMPERHVGMGYILGNGKKRGFIERKWGEIYWKINTK